MRPIAVGEVLHRLISHICCVAAKSRLSEIVLPYGQVGVGISGGLEAAIHSLSSSINSQGSDPTLCCLKLDMSKAYNNGHRECFLHRCTKNCQSYMPGFNGVTIAGELLLGRHKLHSTAGVQ